jgi:hypothetical protein
MFHEVGGTGHLTRPRWNPGPNGQRFTLYACPHSDQSSSSLTCYPAKDATLFFKHAKFKKQKGLQGWAADEKGVKTKPKKTNRLIPTGSARRKRQMVS